MHISNQRSLYRRWKVLDTSTLLKMGLLFGIIIIQWFDFNFNFDFWFILIDLVFHYLEIFFSKIWIFFLIIIFSDFIWFLSFIFNIYIYIWIFNSNLNFIIILNFVFILFILIIIWFTDVFVLSSSLLI